ncbi:MAG: SCO family protein [Casimicrobiaceae bacterium]
MKTLGTKPYAGLIILLLAIAALPIGSRSASAWNSTGIAGGLPTLQFTMTRASDDKTVTAADYRGKIVLLYFGYTFCPDVCPTTLVNLTQMLKALATHADDVRVLFVTVDPDRDTLSALARYTESFAPQVVGLRGTPDQLASLAKRYRVAYSVQPAGNGRDYEVTHGSAVYVFDRNGAATLLFTGLSTAGAGFTGMIEDLRQLIAATGTGNWWTRMLQFMDLGHSGA